LGKRSLMFTLSKARERFPSSLKGKPKLGREGGMINTLRF